MSKKYSDERAAPSAEASHAAFSPVSTFLQVHLMVFLQVHLMVKS
jgi:hypothetical protein